MSTLQQTLLDTVNYKVMAYCEISPRRILDLTVARIKRRHVMRQETRMLRIKFVKPPIITASVLCHLATHWYRGSTDEILQINQVFVPAVGDRDSDDLRQNSSALFPSSYYVNFLNLPSIKEKIGAVPAYSECSGGSLFGRTGDVRLG